MLAVDGIHTACYNGDDYYFNSVGWAGGRLLIFGPILEGIRQVQAIGDHYSNAVSMVDTYFYIRRSSITRNYIGSTT